MYDVELEAKKGCPDAQYQLGEEYSFTKGREKEGAYWYHQAAIQGNVYACHDLAWMYEIGEGVEKNYQIALFWYILSDDKYLNLKTKNIKSKLTKYEIDDVKEWVKLYRENS